MGLRTFAEELAREYALLRRLLFAAGTLDKLDRRGIVPRDTYPAGKEPTMTLIDLAPGTPAVDEEGRTIVFVDGEEQVPVSAFDATHGVYTVRVYGEDYFVRLTDHAAFRPGGVNG